VTIYAVGDMPIREAAKLFAKDLVKSLALYCLIVAGGTVLILLALSAIGYLPYSDRPGPGWHSAHIPTLREISFYLSFGIFFLINFCLLWGAALFVFARCLGWLSAPRVFVALTGGFAAGLVTLMGMAGTGWYIAVAAFPVYTAGILGLVFGAAVLPRFAGIRSNVCDWKHWLGIAVTVTVFVGLILYPILSKQDRQSLHVAVARLVPDSKVIESNSKTLALSDEQLTFLKSHGLIGSLHFGMESYSGSLGETAVKAQAFVLFTQPIKSRVELRQPKKGTSILYVQIGDKWLKHPEDAPTIERKIAFWPSEQGAEVHFQIDSGRVGSFSWYPPMIPSAVGNAR
jgi:MFS family permease